MNITFDPMTEAAAVRRMLDALLDREDSLSHADFVRMLSKNDPAFPPIEAPAAPTTVPKDSGRHVVQRAVPLYPAPSTAAADVFPTAPEVPTPGAVTPPPVPVPPVPSVPTPDAPSAPAGATSPVAVDKNGLPWDERIHSGTKAQNADGSWRQRRGLNGPDLVQRVENELRAALRVVPLAPAVPVPPVPGVPPVASAEISASIATTSPTEVPNAAPASSAVPTAPIPTPPVPPVPTAPASTATPISFAQVMTKVTELHRAGKVVDADVHGALAAVGLGPNEIGKLAKQDEATAGHRQTVATILDDIAGGA